METIPYENIGKQSYKIRIYGQERMVKRVGLESTSLFLGLLIYTDCEHPAQNIVVEESKIESWERV